MKAVMLTRILSAAAVLGMVPQLTPAARGADYEVDRKHSTVTFRIQHLNVSNFYGRFNDVKGTFAFDESGPAGLSLNIEVRAASIDTNDKKRDDHLKGPDFFHVKQHDTIKFESTEVKQGDGDAFSVTGNLTLHGVTKAITVDLELVGSGADPWGGHRAGFETSFSIKRSDFGMNYMQGGLGDEVRVTVSLEGTRK